jgi:integration host factor subunit alpha
MTITKADLIKRIYEKEVLSKPDATKVVETFLEIIKSRLSEGEDILISGFGKFIVKDKKARKGRNPHTGETIILAPRRVVTFKPSGVLRKKLNPQ